MGSRDRSLGTGQVGRHTRTGHSYLYPSRCRLGNSPAAIWALARIGGKRAPDTIIHTLRYDKSYHVRQTAATQLCLLNAHIFESLAQCLPTDKSPEVRKMIIEQLGKTGEERALEILHTLEQDDVEYIRTYAAHALGKTRNARIIKPLFRFLRDKSTYVCHATTQALAHLTMQTGQTKGVLIAIAIDTWRVFWGISAAVDKRKGKQNVALRLLEVLRHHHSVRKDADLHWRVSTLTNQLLERHVREIS